MNISFIFKLRNFRVKTVVIIIPILLGGFIYFFFRTTRIVLFNVFDMVGVLDTLMPFREILGQYADEIPYFVKYCLPNGLWCFSFLFFVFFSIKEEKGKLIKITALILALHLLELLQIKNILPGTFDMMDLVTISGFSILFLLINTKLS